jgi:peptidoglycan hydrolase-like protein with peptidoglycan-binding domain
MNSGPTISAGSTGGDVHRLQVLLVEMKLLEPAGIDGDFGPNTDGSVRSFQESAGLGVDGIVGPLTWAALPADPNTRQLATGDTGGAVAALQQGLTAYSNEDPATNPGAIDGDFGPMTDAAVRAYQSDRGVGVDGIVGDQTWWVPSGAAGATLASLAGLTTV